MNIVRVVAVLRDGGRQNKNYKLILLCGINEAHQIEDGEWMGYTKNESFLNPFILKDRKSLFYGGEYNYLEPTNILHRSIEVGQFFTITNPPEAIETWESTYEIVSCHSY